MKYTKLAVGILSVVILMTVVSFFVLNRNARAPGHAQKQTSEKIVAPDTAPVATSRVAIQNYQLVPQAIVIEKGETVIWTNADNISHEIIFYFKSGKQSSGVLEPGASYSRSFDKIGTVLYVLRANPGEAGAVTVGP